MTTKPPEVWIYNPDDEPDDSAQFGGVVFPLPANAAVKLERPAAWNSDLNGPFNPHAVAAHILNHLGQWGVCVVGGPVTNGRASRHEDQAIVDSAEHVYLSRTTAWASEIIAAYEARIAPFKSANVPAPPMTSEERKAHEWWSGHRKKVEALAKQEAERIAKEA